MVLEVLSAHARRGLAALPERVQRRQPLAELALEKLRNCGIAELLMSADVGTPLARVQPRAHDLSLTLTLCGLASGPDDVWLLARLACYSSSCKMRHPAPSRSSNCPELSDHRKARRPTSPSSSAHGISQANAVI